MRIKYLLLIISLFAFATSNGQVGTESIIQELSDIKTPEQAESYLKAKEKLFRGQLYQYNSNDTSELANMFLSKEAGDILAFESNDRNKTFIFKILQFEDIELLRVQYIYFNNNEIDIHRIDSLRQLILNKLNGGESFDNLAKMYSMDGNAKNGGDLGWFEEGMMMNEFEDAIRKNDFGEIFKVDIPSEKWYYIVKNSYKPLRGKRVTAICVEVSN